MTRGEAHEVEKGRSVAQWEGMAPVMCVVVEAARRAQWQHAHNRARDTVHARHDNQKHGCERCRPHLPDHRVDCFFFFDVFLFVFVSIFPQKPLLPGAFF
jgi:hypothetical protein